MKKNITINLCGRLYQIDEDAYELLSHFEQSVSATHLFGIRLSILWKNLVRRPSTTLLVTSPTDS